MIMMREEGSAMHDVCAVKQRVCLVSHYGFTGSSRQPEKK